MFDARQRRDPRLRDLRSGVLGLMIGLLIMLLPGAAYAGEFGDVAISTKSEPKGHATHGYSEYVFTVTNRSTTRGHEVTLVIPHEAMPYRQMDYIRSISRTIQVEPKTTLQVALLHPDYPPVGGDGLKVLIDGREQEDGLGLAVASSGGGFAGFAGHRRRGGFYSPRPSAFPGGSENSPLLLVSQRVGDKFVPDLRAAFGRSIPEAGGLAPGMVLGAPPGTTILDFVRSEDPVGNWGSRWLGYSRYDGIALTVEEMETLHRGPADSQAIRTALLQYVEAGGVLILLDAGALTLPASWSGNQATQKEGQVSYGGFGACYHFDERDPGRWSNDAQKKLQTSLNRTGAPFQNRHTLQEANENLPIIEDLALPVRGMFVLLLLFTIVIGPLNMWLLGRWKRRIWLLWTVPTISLATCAAVFGYMIVAEGWQGRTRATAFTLLDENEQRATTLGRSACYSPLTPSDGLHFSQDTEVTVQGMDGSDASASICDIDWTRDQHFRRGWVSARVPAHFLLRRSDAKRLERLPLSREADGTVAVTNQLGARIARLWLADEKGLLYKTDEIQVGQRGVLTRQGNLALGKGLADRHRQLFGRGDWSSLGRSITGTVQDYLPPGSYLAVLESSPFLEPGLAGAVVRPTESYVLGIMARQQ